MNALSLLDGILFAFGEEGVTQEQLKVAMNLDDLGLEELIETYEGTLNEGHRGVKLIRYGDRFKLATASVLHEVIAAMLKYDKARSLSSAALETLAIIAYKAPITRIEIEEIRGVNSDMMCRRLEALDLIRESGRAESPGRPILYGVTDTFMDVFKLTTLKELPEIHVTEMEEHSDFYKR